MAETGRNLALSFPSADSAELDIDPGRQRVTCHRGVTGSEGAALPQREEDKVNFYPSFLFFLYFPLLVSLLRRRQLLMNLFSRVAESVLISRTGTRGFFHRESKELVGGL